ncbi:site-specific DNA-methyltransferase [Bacteroides heparinolyticus]|uniref:DNA-methyltransferase n=2 Tax=Prevotella heparinolytica TaxID=28113 RepID=UPI00359F70EE
MIVEQLNKIQLINADCMEVLKELPDKSFDLAIIDPPYGLKEDGKKNATRSKKAKSKCYGYKGWDNEPPPSDFFKELMRVSKNQIVFGANHFISKIPIDSSCWIVWDKDNGGTDFADCELAWTSFKTSVRKFKFKWQGMLQENMKNKEVRIHPTQKPVALYRFIIQKYAKAGDKILDTHLGSGSIALACDELGFELTGIEIDNGYYEGAKKRLIYQQAQPRLFDREEEISNDVNEQSLFDL